jgi:regulator of CtrA degradation
MLRTMAEPADLSPTIVEALYNEALFLADEARAAFDLSGRLTTMSEGEDLARIALSCEALRTTTRMMHAIAWLLNQRASFAGELSEFQLRRHGRLPPPQRDGSPDQLALLGPEIESLIERTRRFYARIERLDMAWRTRFAMHPAAIHRLRERLGGAVGHL